MTSMGSRHPSKIFHTVTLCIIGISFTLAGCSQPTNSPTSSPVISTTPETTATLPQPTPTSQPLAAQVNGEGISVLDFNAELGRYQASAVAMNPVQTPEDQHNLVIQEMIDQVLLAQAAYQEGFILDDTGLEERLRQLADQAGGQEALAAWISGQGYTGEQFEAALRRAAAAAWKRDQIIAAVPEEAEQVHVRQIVVYNQADADTAFSRLTSGEGFQALAMRYDPVTGGDLGWFPRGYLTAPEVEEVAFSLQPGETSGIIQSAVGFHIIQVIEREPEKSLNPDARLVLEKLAIQEWLSANRSQAEIVVTLP